MSVKVDEVVSVRLVCRIMRGRKKKRSSTRLAVLPSSDPQTVGKSNPDVEETEKVKVVNE